MSLGQKAAVGAKWVLGSRALARLLNFGGTLVLARVLVPADFGLVAMALAFEGAIQAMSAFPVVDALLRRPEEGTELYDAAFTIQAIRTLGTGALIAAAAPLAAIWFSEPRLVAVLLVIAGVTALSGFFNVGTVQFQRELRFDVQFKLSIVPIGLQLLTTVTLALLTHSYWALVAGFAVMRISYMGMSYAVHPYRPRFSLAGWRELVGFSFWLWLAGIATMVWQQLDKFVVGPAFGSAGLGLYTLASQTAGLPTTELLVPISTVMFASFAYAQREKATASSANPVLIASALLLLIAPLALVISAGSGQIVGLLLGKKWLAAAPLVALAAWRCLFHPFQSVGAAALMARGTVRSNFIITAFAAVVRVFVVTLAASTGSLPIVIAATLVALTFWSGLYMVVLWPELKAQATRIMASILRAVVALGAASALLSVLHLGWEPVESLSLHSITDHAFLLLHLVLIAIIVLTVYTAVMSGLWVLVDRPAGPEQTLLAGLFNFLPTKWLTKRLAWPNS